MIGDKGGIGANGGILSWGFVHCMGDTRSWI